MFKTAGPSDEVRPVGLITLLVSFALALWYLFHNMHLLMMSDSLFAGIRQWRMDREEYVTDINGQTREQVQQNLLRRCHHWGRGIDATGSGIVCLRYHHSQSITVFYSMIEKRLALCSVPHLDRDTFRSLTRDACSQLKKIQDGRPVFKTKSEREAPVAHPAAVVVLADTVDDEVRRLARKELKTPGMGYVLPCVVDCSTGKYYTDCTKEYYEQGMGGRPEKNYSADIIRRVVFSGRFPEENMSTRPPYPYRFDPEDSL